MFGTQEADAIFRGKEIHKLGPKKYKIVDGAFSTCVQPTPRWEVVSGSATLNLDDYALLKNSVFRVKGVPLMYLPIFYYPIQEDDRATGFLMPDLRHLDAPRDSRSATPSSGRSPAARTPRSIHDWFSKAGQQMGGEYRYVVSGGSQGNARFSFLDEKQVNAATGESEQGRRSYQVTGGMTQTLGGGLRARANADYVSDITPEQLYQQNIYRATRSTRSFGGNITGSWSQFVLSGTLDRTDVFYPDGSFTTYGGLPRINFNSPERRLAKSPFYFGAGAEYVTMLRSTTDTDGVTDPAHDQGLTRMDFAPTLRIPFTRWPFLTVNSTIGWRGTYWTESLVDGQQVPEPIGRQFFDFNSRITGPVFSRIFNAGATEGLKLKHVIEPIVHDPPDHRDRRVRSHRQARGRHRLHRRQRLAGQLRAQQPAVRQADDVARSPQRGDDPELLHRRARDAVRSVLSEQQLRGDAAEQVHRPGAVRAHGADRAAAGRLPHGVGPHVPHAEDARGQRQRQQPRMSRRLPAGAGGATSRGCRDSTTLPLPTTI